MADEAITGCEQCGVAVLNRTSSAAGRPAALFVRRQDRMVTWSLRHRDAGRRRVDTSLVP